MHPWAVWEFAMQSWVALLCIPGAGALLLWSTNFSIKHASAGLRLRLLRPASSAFSRHQLSLQLWSCVCRICSYLAKDPGSERAESRTLWLPSFTFPGQSSPVGSSSLRQGSPKFLASHSRCYLGSGPAVDLTEHLSLQQQLLTHCNQQWPSSR